MVTRQIPSGLSSVLFHICKTRFVGWISSLLTYLLGKTFTVAPKSIWNLTFRRLDIFFVDVFTWQNIYGCTAVDMELNGLLVDKHLCVYFTFRDAVDSSCHLWFQGHTRFPVRIILARLLRVFALWFLRSLHLHLMDIFRFLCSLIHILKLCVRDFVAFRYFDALLQS